jgi:hypothetical protein
MLVRRRLYFAWSCSVYVTHSHRWYWTARLCGWIQEWLR